MRRTEIEKRMRKIAKAKGVDVTFTEGGNHTIVRFDGVKVTMLPRHNEINEMTAKSAIRAAEDWKRT